MSHRSAAPADPGHLATTHPIEDRRDRRRRLGLAALLGGMSVLHVAQPRVFEAMVPTWIPGEPATLNWLATAAEGGSAILLANRRTARVGGWAALATFLAVYPANIQMAVDGSAPGVPVTAATRAALWARLPLQFPLFWLSWRTAHASADVANRPGARS